MGAEIIGLVAVVLTCGLPVAALYTYYRVRKLRTEERLAALARGAQIPVEPELSQFARSRRAGILLVSGGLGFMAMFAVIAKVVGEPETLVAAAFGILPLAVGVGFFSIAGGSASVVATTTQLITSISALGIWRANSRA